MNRFIIDPPKSVPGPFQATALPPVNGVGTVTPRIVRWHVVNPGETLWSIAGKYYRNPGEWVRIMNANRDGVNRPDNTFGTLVSTNIQAGERLHIP